MNAFNQIDCMVESGAITLQKGDNLKEIMAGLPTTVGELLLILTANSFLCCGSSGGSSFIPVNVTGNYTAVNGESIFANTEGGSFVLTLPASPSVNDYVDVYDSNLSFFTNSLTVAGNGSLINGIAGDLIVNIDGSHIRLVYSSPALGWVSFNL